MSHPVKNGGSKMLVEGKARALVHRSGQREHLLQVLREFAVAQVAIAVRYLGKNVCKTDSQSQ